MAVILEIQNGRHNNTDKNGNIGFHTQYIITFPKIYSFTNLSPPKYIVNLTSFNLSPVSRSNARLTIEPV
jgi:hypothetical protein